MSRGRAIVFAGRDRIELVDISVPRVRPDEVLVETEITAISQGTDRVMVAGTYAGVNSRYPFVYGYSRVGRVLEAGADVSGVRASDRVFVGMAGTRLDPADGLGELGGAYTSHAVVHHADVVVLPGDTPLLRPATLAALVRLHRASDAAATLLTAEVDTPGGYGRVVRPNGDQVVRIVEKPKEPAVLDSIRLAKLTVAPHTS